MIFYTPGRYYCFSTGGFYFVFIWLTRNFHLAGKHLTYHIKVNWKLKLSLKQNFYILARHGQELDASICFQDFS